MTPRRSDLLAHLAALAGGLGDVELHCLGRLAERLDVGQRTYGLLSWDRIDRGAWAAERAAESLDRAIYTLFEDLQRERAEKAR